MVWFFDFVLVVLGFSALLGCGLCGLGVEYGLYRCLLVCVVTCWFRFRLFGLLFD